MTIEQVPNKELQSLLTDLKHCHWQDFRQSEFDEIATDLKRTVKKYGHIDYTLFPPTFRWNLCASRLSQGKFDNWDGWEYRSSWSITFQGWNGFQLPIPKWDGKPVGKLIIASEQGIGDEICYASAIPELMVRLGPSALELQCHPRLIPVFERSYGIKCVPRLVLSEITEGDAVVALADLFMIYRRDKGHFPKKPYLKVDDHKRNLWMDKLKNFKKPWIGVAWKSRHGEIDESALQLDLYHKYDGTAFNLQYGEITGKFVYLPVDPLNDMDDHLALVSCMDRVVTVTQTLAHEAGALGIPCDAIKPEKGTGEVDCHLWYYGVGQSPHEHHVYGSVRVWESYEDYVNGIL